MTIRFYRAAIAITASCSTLFVAAAPAQTPATVGSTATLDVDLRHPGPAIPPTFFGLMTEEINHAYDGGLYAELVRNRTFQDPADSVPARPDGKPVESPVPADPPAHWSIVGNGHMSTTRAEPLNPARPISLTLTLTGNTAGLANDGFWGIPVRPDTSYTAEFYARATDGYAGPVTASIVTNDGGKNDGGKTVATADTAPITTSWQKYTLTLTTGHDAPITSDAKFVVGGTGTGGIIFSDISLCPPTFGDVPHGLRPDLMQLLTDLHPRFIRLPGGNYLEGDYPSSRFDWKTQIGPIVDRPGHMGCWGYRSSDGFGLPQYLLWCKQLNAEPVLAVYAGYSLQHDHLTAGPQLQKYVDEALEEIEYVSGPADSEWGKKRAADGFPKPFKLTYVEVGNEDWFDGSGSYEGRFAQFFDAIRAKYPKLKIIATASVTKRKPDLVDEHFYRSERSMAFDDHHYDNYDRNGPHVFSGEWASQEGQPTPDLNAGLADAAWLMGLERNADVVPIECYAPLLVNVNPGAAQWPTNLIGYDALRSFGSPSYYAQSMIGQHRGETVVPVKLTVTPRLDAHPMPPHGAVGVGTWHTQVEYKDLTVTTPDGKTLLKADPMANLDGWIFSGDKWKLQDKTILPAVADSEAWGYTGDTNWTDYDLSVQARKTGGAEGFLVLFHAVDGEHYKWWNVGGWGNTRTQCESSVAANEREQFGPTSDFSVEENRWYTLRVEVRGNHVKCYADGKLITDAAARSENPRPPVFASATSAHHGNELVVKVDNMGAEPVDTTLNLTGVTNVVATGKAYVLTGNPTDVNTVNEPTKVSTQEQDITGLAGTFHRIFPPHSLTLLQMSVTPPLPAATPLGLEHGTIDLDTPDFRLKLVRDSQTISALEPKAAAEQEPAFDFTPADQLTARSGDRFNHLGDVNLRLKVGDGQYASYSTAAHRRPVTPVKTEGALAAADLTPTLGENCPVKIVRTWKVDASGRLVMEFSITNTTAGPVTVGALDFPVVFNNMIQDFRVDRPRTLEQANAICSFSDPYIGNDGGYLQVTRLSGAGPALVVVPEEGTRTPFEAYRPLNDATPREQTFEGAMSWMVHTAAYAEQEWKGVHEWNPPTADTLSPGQSVTHGLRFLVSDTIRGIDRTLAANNRPVVVGVPGYIVPMDVEAKLFVDPAGRKVTGVTADPPDALAIEPGPATKSGGLSYTIRGKQWGRSRAVLSYNDGTTQSVNYDVTKPAAEAVDNLGHFLFTKQWFTDASDPFHRAPSVITYDRSKNKQVTQDLRVWFAGLSDEAGSGSWVAAAMKEFGRPNPDEVAQLEQFVNQTVWGHLQYAEGPKKWGVKKSLFFYQPALVPNFKYMSGDWSSWTSWNKAASDDIGRGYNYPHVVTAYWSLYRLARNHHGLVKQQSWDWYLDHAFNTTKFLCGGFGVDVGYTDTGLMEGDVFVSLLKDLKAEGQTNKGWADKAVELEKLMRGRADDWKQRKYPFGSEMAWDSTGQEEVYAWTHYFEFNDKADVSLDSILGYMPTVPNWGYNGDARRYWDFIYGAAPNQGIERQIHHYGSGINSIPVLTQYRSHPDDFYLLRVGYGGSSGALSSIDQDGFAACAFHSDPAKLRWDSYSGDYGPNFFGHAMTTGTYVVDHPDYGWQAFGGNLRTAAAAVTIVPKDDFRRRIYVAPLGLFLTLDAGTFRSLAINPLTHAVDVTFDPADSFTPAARLHIEQPIHVAGIGTFAPINTTATERGAFVLPLNADAVTITLQPR